MKVENLLGERCLVKVTGAYKNREVSEVIILDLSPSKEHVKLINAYGKEYWSQIDKVQVIEVLSDPGLPKVGQYGIIGYAVDKSTMNLASKG